VAVLTENQKVVQALTDELHRLGAFVVSWPGSERLRFQVLSPQCESTLQKLRDLGFDPMFCNSGLRFERNAAEPCNTYEIYIEPERQPIQDDRIRGELASSAPKSDYETEQVMRYLGWPPSQKRRR
jgi:hypothetical protein